MKDVFISSTGAFLPGHPVPNDEMLEYLGEIDSKSKRFRDFVVRQNGIKTRHYAINKSQKLCFSNAEMAANAVGAALKNADIQPRELKCLMAATTMADLIVPGHASAVHGELGGGPMDIASFQSVCASAMMAIKTAWMNVRCGETSNAIAVGSDLPSVRFRPIAYTPAKKVISNPQVRMSAEFLRWTLSDGAGATLLENKPRGPLSYRIDGIRTRSFAHLFHTCMYAGIAPGKLKDLKQSWSVHPDGVPGSAQDGAMMLLQDMSLLKEIFQVWAEEVSEIAETGHFDPENVDWFLCHYSAKSLRDEFAELLRQRGVDIAMEKWWSNLSWRGNTGAASVFLLLHDFLASGQAKPGDTIYCMVPESGRALMSSMFLTVVEG